MHCSVSIVTCPHCPASSAKKTVNEYTCSKVFLIAVHACIFSEQIPRSPSSSFRNAVYSIRGNAKRNAGEGRPAVRGREASWQGGGGRHKSLFVSCKSCLYSTLHLQYADGQGYSGATHNCMCILACRMSGYIV